ncbi:MAG: alternative ribosome rescue aminoacyl-tRNA hydrolase ArfB [Spirochaetia bacterium]
MEIEVLQEWIHSNGRFDFSRSGGPGGQHVNKTATKVTLHLPLETLPLPEGQKERVLHKLTNRLNSENELVIQSSETRSQARNREVAEQRAFSLIKSALSHPKRRKHTRPPRAANERRLQHKKERSKTKGYRRDPNQ